MTPDDVTVIIPALNEEQRIAAAIQSAWINGAGQVVVCDGGSADQTVAIAKSNRATVVESDAGRGNQLSRGADQSDGALLLFLHADSLLLDGCLEKLCQSASCAHDPDCFWGGFRQQIDDPSVLYRLLEWGNAARIRFRGMPFGDQGIVVTRILYDRVGGFRSLPLMEDVVLSKSLRRECWPVLIDSVIHVDGRRWKQRGLFKQTALNWCIQFAHAFGVSEKRLSKWYR